MSCSSADAFLTIGKSFALHSFFVDEIFGLLSGFTKDTVNTNNCNFNGKIL